MLNALYIGLDTFSRWTLLDYMLRRRYGCIFSRDAFISFIFCCSFLDVYLTHFLCFIKQCKIDRKWPNA